MKEFTADSLNNIHSICKQFLVEKHGDEIVFFDEFWKIYEVELKKWIGKTPAEWRLKLEKLPCVNFLGITDSFQGIEFVTPKIIEVVTASYTYIARIKETLTLTRIEEILKNCAKKLPEADWAETVNFFAPRIFKDLKKAEELPVEKIKKEFEIDSHLEEDESRAFAEKKKYMMYTNENPEGKLLTKTEYLEKKGLYENQAADYKFIIDEVKYECFFNGRKIKIEDKPVKPAWRAFICLLLRKKQSEVSYREIFKFARINERYYENDTYNIVQKWISLFRKYIDKEDDFRWFFTPVREDGYKYQEGADFRFCIFRRL